MRGSLDVYREQINSWCNLRSYRIDCHNEAKERNQSSNFTSMAASLLFLLFLLLLLSLRLVLLLLLWLVLLLLLLLLRQWAQGQRRFGYRRVINCVALVKFLLQC